MSISGVLGSQAVLARGTASQQPAPATSDQSNAPVQDSAQTVSGAGSTNGTGFGTPTVDPAAVRTLQAIEAQSDSEFGLTPQDSSASSEGLLNGVAVPPVGQSASSTLLGSFAERLLDEQLESSRPGSSLDIDV